MGLMVSAAPAFAADAQSIDDLFGGPPPAKKPKPKAAPPAPATEAQSVDDLFGGPPPAAKQPATKSSTPAQAVTPQQTVAPESTVAPQATPSPALATPTQQTSPVGEAATVHLPDLSQTPAEVYAEPARSSVTGFLETDLAYIFAGTKHWSNFNNTLELSAQGSTANGMGWKLSGRVNYNPIYNLTDYYPSSVGDDETFEAMFRETYIDLGAGDWEFRLGRQNIVWGEMVGVFVADAVSAKDLRQFLLPDFDMIRIPQWAARGEYFSGDFHAEAVWIPYMTYDNIGVPGMDFYPFTPPVAPGYQSVIADEQQPHGLDDSAYGGRLSWIKDGWDVSGFYYTTNDPTPAYSRQTSLNTIIYTPIHKRIYQLGATLGKDLGPMVLKAEALYTHDRLVSTLDPLDADGLVKQNIFDYIIGLEWSFPQETRFNMQFFQRWIPNANPDIVADDLSSGVSVLLSTQALHHKLEPQLLVLSSLDRVDWMAQFKLAWKPGGNWLVETGLAYFGGSTGTGLFANYDNNDQIYTNVRYSF
jgi:hypothetical protein